MLYSKRILQRVDAIEYWGDEYRVDSAYGKIYKLNGDQYEFLCDFLYVAKFFGLDGCRIG